jgi:hypothetical protein
MAIFLKNEEIQALIIEEKQVLSSSVDLFLMKSKKGHRESEITIPRPDGSAFKIILRQNSNDPLDFSAILAFVPENKKQDFKLRRYNGKHLHGNRLHKNKFYDFHIHTASEEYQRAGLKEESFAEVTARYSNLAEAFACLVKDCNVTLPEDKQLKFL